MISIKTIWSKSQKKDQVEIIKKTIIVYRNPPQPPLTLLYVCIYVLNIQPLHPIVIIPQIKKLKASKSFLNFFLLSLLMKINVN